MVKHSVNQILRKNSRYADAQRKGVVKTNLKEKEKAKAAAVRLASNADGKLQKLSRRARRRARERQVAAGVTVKCGASEIKVNSSTVPLRFHIPKPKPSVELADAEIDSAIEHS